MSNPELILVALFMAGVLFWQFRTGNALGGWWWRPTIDREDSLGAYWFVLAIQLVILIAFLTTGYSWQLRGSP